MKITVRKTEDPRDFSRITPNYIYNRFDLFCTTEEFEAVILETENQSRVVEFRIQGDRAELGIQLMPITQEELEALEGYIRREYAGVKRIVYKNGTLTRGKANAHNYFRIEFPDTVEQMESRVSPKSWSKMRRRNRRAEEAYGPMRLLEYSGDQIPLEIVDTFFRYKQATRGREYGMDAQEYLERYHVTDCYAVMFGETMGAMHFCCEQCPIVNGENHSYNPELKEYSLGKFIFAHSLIRMVEKGHTAIFLAGGDFEYKTHYGSIEDTVYDCELYLGGGLGALWHRMDPVGKLKTVAKRILRRGSGQTRKPHTQTAQQKEEG